MRAPDATLKIDRPATAVALAVRQRVWNGRTGPTAALIVSADLERHVEWLRRDASLGFDRIYLHHVGRDLMPFIETFGTKVLPVLR